MGHSPLADSLRRLQELVARGPELDAGLRWQLRALERAVDSGDPARLALAAGGELPDAVIRWAYDRWEGDLAELPVVALWHLGTDDVTGAERVLDAWAEALAAPTSTGRSSRP